MDALAKRRLSRWIGWGFLIGSAPVLYLSLYLLVRQPEPEVPLVEVLRPEVVTPGFAERNQRIMQAIGELEAADRALQATPRSARLSSMLLDLQDSVRVQRVVPGSQEAAELLGTLEKKLEPALRTWDAVAGLRYTPLVYDRTPSEKDRLDEDLQVQEELRRISEAQNRVHGLVYFMARARAHEGDWNGAVQALGRQLSLTRLVEPVWGSDYRWSQLASEAPADLLKLGPDEKATGDLLEVIRKQGGEFESQTPAERATQALTQMASAPAEYRPWGLLAFSPVVSMMAWRQLNAFPELVHEADRGLLGLGALDGWGPEGLDSPLSHPAMIHRLSAVMERNPGVLTSLGYSDRVATSVTKEQAVQLVAARRDTRSNLVGTGTAAVLALRLHALRTGTVVTRLEDLPRELWSGSVPPLTSFRVEPVRMPNHQIFGSPLRLHYWERTESKAPQTVSFRMLLECSSFGDKNVAYEWAESLRDFAGVESVALVRDRFPTDRTIVSNPVPGERLLCDPDSPEWQQARASDPKPWELIEVTATVPEMAVEVIGEFGPSRVALFRELMLPPMVDGGGPGAGP